MVKLRKQINSKKQIAKDVKIENQQEHDVVQSSTYSDYENENSCQEKELDEKKIIKEFLMKRKLLMKALKQKQKQKNPRLLTLETFQNNEGSSSSHQIYPESQNYSNEPQIQNQQIQSLSSSIQENQIKIDQHDINGSKTSIAIQTKIQNKKKYIKKIHSNKKNSQKDIFDCLIQNSNTQQKNTNKGQFQHVSKKIKNTKDLEKIKKQIISHFSKVNGQQIRQDKQKCVLNPEKFSSSQTFQICYNKISTAMRELNEEIQNYYDSKLLKRIIIKQIKSKVNGKTSQGYKTINTVQDNIKSKPVKKKEKYQSLFLGTEEFENKIFRKRAYYNKREERKNKAINKKPFRRIINDKFKSVLAVDNNLEKKQNNENNIYEHEGKDQENFSQTQADFDPTQAWKSQFKNIQLMLLQKYNYLEAYMTRDKSIDYQSIYNNTRLRARQNSAKIPRQNKTSNDSSKSISDFQSYIDTKQTNKNNDQVPSKIIKKKKTKINKGKIFKQLQIDRKDQDQFGKSFDLCQGTKITNNQQNFILEDMNKSNILSHVFNSSFYSQFSHKKSNSNSDDKNKNLNLSFISQQENLQFKSQLMKSQKGSIDNKGEKLNQSSLSKYSQGKQPFYMSQQIVLDLNFKK